MRSSYGGPGSSRSTWKPTQDPGKQAPAAASGQHGMKNDEHRMNKNTTQERQSTQQFEKDRKKN